MEEFFRENFKSIVIGILSSVLFLYFFQPVLDFIGSSFLHLLSMTNSKYSDDFYSKIAHLELIDFSFYWLAILFGGMAMVCGSISIKGFLGMLSKKESTLRKNGAKSRGQRVGFYGLNIFIALFMILFLSTKIYQLKLITSFKQHMRIIAPYIEEQVEEELISEWSIMNSADDYEKIYIRLNKTATDNGLELPENKIYSLTSF